MQAVRTTRQRYERAKFNVGNEDVSDGETHVGTCFCKASSYFVPNATCATSDDNGTSIESELLENTVLDRRVGRPDRGPPVCAV